MKSSNEVKRKTMISQILLHKLFQMSTFKYKTKNNSKIYLLYYLRIITYQLLIMLIFH